MGNQWWNSPFARLVLRRAVESSIALLLAATVVFAGVRSIPGDPAVALSGEGRDPAVIEAVRERYGLNESMPVQFVRWARLTVTGDFGTSSRTREPVRETLGKRLPVTLQLAAWSMLIALAVGIPAGVISAVRRGRPADYLANTASLAGLSIPNFWLGLLLITFVAIPSDFFPASGYVAPSESLTGHMRYMALPAIVLGTGLSAIFMRQMRSSMIDSLTADYVKLAHAKGLRATRVIVRHAMRNSLTTVVTVGGLELGALIAGSVVTETVFLVPGFGKLLIDAIATRDYATIQAVALVSASAYIVLNLAVDILYFWLNPKIRTTGAGR